LGDAIAVTWTDSWDDNLPTDCPGDISDPFYLDGRCYDGLRNFNQVRPGVFDGGYAFPGFTSDNPDGIRSGVYIVQVVPPPNYEIVSAEDMNVVFGETYEPAVPMAFPFVPPCVGAAYDVPEEIALFPGTLHPYWDPEHPLYKGSQNPVSLSQCDFKQLFLSPGVNGAVDFFLHTEVPIAAHLTGFILNDLANEFDPDNPNFGEKAALPFVPVSFRDWTGREITRVYSDQYGNYNALVPSTFTANAPFPSGMSPAMLLACMNDPGPIPGPGGTLMQDPHFKPQYTQFCYTFQYMPGTTTYLDTPVEPIAAFAGQNQNPLDCEFKSGTPVIKTVKGDGRVGPYVSGAGQIFTIEALGQTFVPNPAYTVGGTEPLNISRDYGFGTGGVVTLNGITVPAASVSWGSSSIRVTLPGSFRPGRYQVMVKRNDTGLTSIVGLTLTVGGAYREVTAPGGISRWPAHPIQDAIDAANPGDLILVGEGYYEELVVMWKPVLLQGAGAYGVTINAVKTPGEKLEAWRDKVAGLFAAGHVAALPGQRILPDPEGVELGLLGGAEGPGIMVLAKNAFVSQGGFGMSGAFSNARIDGLTITGSDIAGGIFVNGYARYLQITNNRIRNNAGLTGGGITIGHADILTEEEAPVDADNDYIVLKYNHITQNGSRSGGAGGGVSLYTGATDYTISDCWICGNFTKGSGGGIGHQGLSPRGLIAQNTIIYNQAFNQLPGTRPGAGGIAIEGFVPILGGFSPGAGSVLIDDNLILGNLAGAGDGGGIGLSHVNGLDVANFGTIPSRWYRVTITNNMIVNNMAGMAGGGIALKDTAYAVIVNNTIARNDSAAVAGELIDPLSGESVSQAAGIAAYAHSAALAAEFGTGLAQTFSKPLMANNIVWENRSFYWSIDGEGRGGLVPDTPIFRDLEVVGVPGALTCEGCVLTGAPDPFVRSYFNNNGTLSIFPEDTTPLTAAAVDEGGNFIDLRFGPLTLWDPGNGLELFGDYHIRAGSAAEGAGVNTVQSAFNPGGTITNIVLVDQFKTLLRDYDEQTRPIGAIDAGADER
jgi:hypothetical protein